MLSLKKCKAAFVASVVVASSSNVDAGVLAPRTKALLNKERSHSALRENSKVLAIRGGAGPLEPMLAAKLVIGAAMASGLVANLAPSLANEKYGLESTTVTVDWLTKNFGAGMISFSVFGYCLLVKDTGLPFAVSHSLIPWVYNNLGQVVNRDAEKAGFGAAGFKFALVLHAITMYGCTQDWADTILKVAASFWTLVGAQMLLTPKSAAKAWGSADEMDLASISYIRATGSYLFAHYVPVLSMVFKGTEPLKAFGQGSVFWFLNMASHLFITKDFEKLGLPLGPMYVWLIFYAIVAATILL